MLASGYIQSTFQPDSDFLQPHESVTAAQAGIVDDGFVDNKCTRDQQVAAQPPLHQTAAAAAGPPPRAPPVATAAAAPPAFGNGGFVDVKLSHEQLAVWLFDRLQNDRSVATFVLPLTFRLQGLPWSPTKLGGVLEALVARHEALRTVLHAGGDAEPRQRISAKGLVPDVQFIDASGAPDVDAVIRHTTEAEVQRPFDIMDPTQPLMRALLLRLSARDHVVCLCFHHLIVDGISLALLTQELVVAVQQGTQALYALPAPGAYRDFVGRTVPLTEKAEEHLRHWVDRLADVPSLDLATTVPYPALPTFKGGHVTQTLRDPDVLGRLQELRRHAKCTDFVVHLCAWFLSLLPLARQPHFALGMYTSTRKRADAGTVGLFINTLCIVGDMRDDPTLQDFVQRVKENVQVALRHQDVPYDVLVKQLPGKRQASGVCRVGFVLCTAEHRVLFLCRASSCFAGRVMVMRFVHVLDFVRHVAVPHASRWCVFWIFVLCFVVRIHTAVLCFASPGFVTMHHSAAPGSRCCKLCSAVLWFCFVVPSFVRPVAVPCASRCSGFVQGSHGSRAASHSSCTTASPPPRARVWTSLTWSVAVRKSP